MVEDKSYEIYLVTVSNKEHERTELMSNIGKLQVNFLHQSQ